MNLTVVEIQQCGIWAGIMGALFVHSWQRNKESAESSFRRWGKLSTFTSLTRSLYY